MLGKLIATIILALTLAACTGSGSETSSTTSKPNQSSTTTVGPGNRPQTEKLEHNPDLKPDASFGSAQPNTVKVDWNGDEEGYSEPPEEFTEEKSLGEIPDRSDVNNDDIGVYDELDLEESDPFD